MATEIEVSTLEWSARKLLQQYFMEETKGVGGIYLWGFYNGEVDVVWYIGKSSHGKGLNTRLRDHYLNIMSGRYQIPYYFLDGTSNEDDGTFTEDKSTGSGWKASYKNPDIAKKLSDWNHMKRVHHAGHTFAHEAFARVITGISDDELANVERQAIRELRPAINNQISKAVSELKYTFKESAGDEGWIEAWLNYQRERH